MQPLLALTPMLTPKGRLYGDLTVACLAEDHFILFGSGASTTHNPRNLPTMLAGGSNMGLKHGTYWRHDDTRMSNVFLSILHSMGIHQESFADSTGTITDSIFDV